VYPDFAALSAGRNGRARGGDAFDLEVLAGGQTRQREGALVEMTQGMVPPMLTVPKDLRHLHSIEATLCSPAAVVNIE
jgi:hypothetical protein